MGFGGKTLPFQAIEFNLKRSSSAEKQWRTEGLQEAKWEESRAWAAACPLEDFKEGWCELIESKVDGRG